MPEKLLSHLIIRSAAFFLMKLLNVAFVILFVVVAVCVMIPIPFALLVDLLKQRDLILILILSQPLNRKKFTFLLRP